MKYLLDVNALIALGLDDHQFHRRTLKWLAGSGFPVLLTTSITELGFVRILAQAPLYECTVVKAREALETLKQTPELQITFIPDTHDISHLPAWVKSPKQTTEGHLLALAAAHGALLATFDEKISGAFLIP